MRRTSQRVLKLGAWHCHAKAASTAMHFRTSALCPISIINKDAFPNIFDDASMAAPEMKLGPGNSFIMHSDTGTIYGQLSGRESESMPFPDDLSQGSPKPASSNSEQNVTGSESSTPIPVPVEGMQSALHCVSTGSSAAVVQGAGRAWDSQEGESVIYLPRPRREPGEWVKEIWGDGIHEVDETGVWRSHERLQKMFGWYTGDHHGHNDAGWHDGDDTHGSAGGDMGSSAMT